MVVPAAGGEHIILAQQIHGFLCGSGAVQHKTDGKGGKDALLAGLLVGGLTVQREHGNGNAFFVHAVQADEGRGQGSDSGLGAVGGMIGRQIVQRRKSHRLVAVFGVAVDQHGGSVLLEIVIAAHEDIPVRVRDAEGAAAKVRGGHVDGQQRHGLLQDGVQHILIGGNAIVDEAVQIVGIGDVHPVELVVPVGGQLPDAADGADAGGVKQAQTGDADEHERQKRKKNAADDLFHEGFLLSVGACAAAKAARLLLLL